MFGFLLGGLVVRVVVKILNFHTHIHHLPASPCKMEYIKICTALINDEFKKQIKRQVQQQSDNVYIAWQRRLIAASETSSLCN
jgi:hypothetical protein